MRLDVDGVEVGHWSDPVARTGCTVIVLPEATVASGEVRGGAPATREFALLDPQRLVDRVDAVVLTGGSAFGLASADGVAAELERMDRGFPTPAGPVPIVVAMALFDLAVGDATVRPGPAAGRRAFAARSHDPAVGTVGAGTGATIAKWRGPDRSRPGGLGVGTVARGDLVVTAVVAVNAAGEPDGGILEEVTEGSLDGWAGRSQPFTNTTIGCVVTNAAIDKSSCLLVAQGGHDGLARALVPVHTRADGDAVVAAATGEIEADVDEVRLLAVAAVVEAVTVAVGTIEG